MNDPIPTIIYEDGLICKCMHVKESVIRKTISNNNLKTIDQVTASCDAGGGCHSCHILIQLFLDEFHNKPTIKEELIADHGSKVSKKGILSTFLSKIKPSKT